MKKTHLVFVSLLLILCSCGGKTKRNTTENNVTGIEKAEAFGWNLAIQSYTFHKFNVIEALDKTKELGIHYIEIYPGHKLGGEWGDTPFGYQMTKEQIKGIKDLAASKDITIVGTGVFTTDNPDDWKLLFDFAKEMNLEFITCEPNIEHWDIVEELSKESGIKVAVHNHPKPSNYWNANLLMDQIKDRSTTIGSCADIGHWSREGFDPTESFKTLQGRVISLHIKDILDKPEDGSWQEDTIWGHGILNLEEILSELKKQDFKGFLSIEYEYNWENSVNDIKECIKHYEELTDKIF